MRGVSGFRRKPSIALPLVLTTIWIATVSDCQSNRTQNLPTSALQKLFFPDLNGICRGNSPISGAGSEGRTSRISSSVS